MHILRRLILAVKKFLNAQFLLIQLKILCYIQSNTYLAN